MSENGGAPLSAIPVPTGSYLEITDYDVASGGAQGDFRLQQTNDGAAWFTIGALQTIGVGMGAHKQVNPDTPWRVDGGADVAVRVAITTPGGPLAVACVMNGYRVT
jgi:hypothetical protein